MRKEQNVSNCRHLQSDQTLSSVETKAEDAACGLRCGNYQIQAAASIRPGHNLTSRVSNLLIATKWELSALADPLQAAHSNHRTPVSPSMSCSGGGLTFLLWIFSRSKIVLQFSSLTHWVHWAPESGCWIVGAAAIISHRYCQSNSFVFYFKHFARRGNIKSFVSTEKCILHTKKVSSDFSILNIHIKTFMDELSLTIKGCVCVCLITHFILSLQ